MNLVDYLILAAVAAILGFALWYIHRSTKKGRKCVGCPGNCASCTGCNVEK